VGGWHQQVTDLEAQKKRLEEEVASQVDANRRIKLEAVILINK
jgi:hypothetical protein